MTLDPFFTSIQKEGFRLEWKEGEPIQRGRRPCRLEKEKEAAFNAEHKRLTSEVHPVFAVHQATKWRSIYNLKEMNPFLVERKFKMTGVGVWKGMIFKNMYMATIDIKDAYLHISVHEDSRRFMRYEWKGHIWALKALPFGLSQAPWVFTRMLKPLLQNWRLRLKISVIAWLLK